MKKANTILLVAVLLLSMVACSGRDGSTPNSTLDVSSMQSPSDNEPSVTPEPTLGQSTKDIRVSEYAYDLYNNYKEIAEKNDLRYCIAKDVRVNENSYKVEGAVYNWYTYTVSITPNGEYKAYDRYEISIHSDNKSYLYISKSDDFAQLKNILNDIIFATIIYMEEDVSNGDAKNKAQTVINSFDGKISDFFRMGDFIIYVSYDTKHKNYCLHAKHIDEMKKISIDGIRDTFSPIDYDAIQSKLNAGNNYYFTGEIVTVEFNVEFISVGLGRCQVKVKTTEGKNVIIELLTDNHDLTKLVVGNELTFYCHLAEDTSAYNPRFTLDYLE